MALPVVLTTPDEIDTWRGNGTLGLVMTMGALHEGHASLIRQATADCDSVIASIFVNPAQFNDPADLERYPRPFDIDRAFAGRAGAGAIYAPTGATVYPEGHATQVQVRGVTDRWEGACRPGHFAGVATIVTIMLNQVQPDRSYFGEKDWQQLAMIRRLAVDLALPGDIVGAPLMRDRNGLALSSRNAHLSEQEYEAALVIPATLRLMHNLAQTGERATSVLLEAGRELLARHPEIGLDYLAVVDPDTLAPVDDLREGGRALIAATVGATRLIDTMDLGRPMMRPG